MPTLFRSLVLACCTFGAARAQSAASHARDAMLVSQAWLAAHLHDANLVLLHVGDESKYAGKHIAGARLMTNDDISVSDMPGMGHKSSAGVEGTGLVLEMPPAEELRTDLASFGISNDSRIVVYFADGYLTSATRVIFTLDYAGLGGRVSLLDGGIDAWTRAGQPLTDVVPATARPGKLAALSLRPLVVKAAYVHDRAHTQGVSVVDARAASYYDGTQKGNGGAARLGHIPGAKSVPFTAVTDDRLELKSPEQLASLFTAAGVQPGDTVVGYCHIGQQATALLFAARSLGHPVLLYDGSFQDWSAHAEYPVELPPKSKP